MNWTKKEREDRGCLMQIAFIVGMIILIVFLFSLPVYFLWNWLMPDIFDLPRITYWQSLGIMFLAALLFNTGGSK